MSFNYVRVSENSYKILQKLSTKMGVPMDRILDVVINKMMDHLSSNPSARTGFSQDKVDTSPMRSKTIRAQNHTIGALKGIGGGRGETPGQTASQMVERLGGQDDNRLIGMLKDARKILSLLR